MPIRPLIRTHGLTGLDALMLCRESTVMPRVCSAFALATMLTLLISPVRAEEQMRPLAQGGLWIAMAHAPSITAPPDVCMATAPSTGLALRADEDGVEVRYINSKWSLPVGVKGSIGIIISGGETFSFDVSANTSTIVTSTISPGNAIRLLDGLAKASNISVTVGKDKPVGISMLNSARVIRAFRTCAHIEGDVTPAPNDSGTNPFR